MERVTFQMYWGQFRLIEKRMIELSDYVTIDPKNYSTFSNQFISMYLTICSEIDSLADEFCKEFDASVKERYGITKKINLLIDKYPKLQSWKCKTKFPYEEINFVPFAKFNETDSADWWKAYNLVKHKRTEKDENGNFNYQKANLKNIMLSLSALFVILSKAKEELCPNFPTDIESNILEIDFIN